MKPRTIWFLVPALLFYSAMFFGQGGTQQRPPASDTVAPNIPGVVAGGTKVQVIKEGFRGTEGPIALPDGSLIFTETAASRITRIDKDGNTSTFLENTDETNGLAFDATGRLIGVARALGKAKIAVLYPKGKEAVLSDNFEGKPFVRPNDLVLDKKGGVYFTDPANLPSGSPPPVLPPAVYYVPVGGKSIKVVEGIKGPNGVQLSPDERTLYVGDSLGEYIFAFDIQPDGTLRNRRNFGKLENPTRAPDGTIEDGADGIAVDSEGRLYVATDPGIQVFSSRGENLGTVPISRSPQNLAFAGLDKKTLYVVGSGAAWKIQMQSQGFKGRAK